MDLGALQVDGQAGITTFANDSAAPQGGPLSVRLGGLWYLLRNHPWHTYLGLAE